MVQTFFAGIKIVAVGAIASRLEHHLLHQIRSCLHYSRSKGSLSRLEGGALDRGLGEAFA